MKLHELWIFLRFLEFPPTGHNGYNLIFVLSNLPKGDYFSNLSSLSMLYYVTSIIIYNNGKFKEFFNHRERERESEIFCPKNGIYYFLASVLYSPVSDLSII